LSKAASANPDLFQGKSLEQQFEESKDKKTIEIDKKIDLKWVYKAMSKDPATFDVS
jgi:hypothetical protein